MGRRKRRREKGVKQQKCTFHTLSVPSNPTLWPLHHNDVIHYLDAVFTVEVSSTDTGIEIELESLQSVN